MTCGGAGHWRLSPVVDVNSAPEPNPHQETAIMEQGPHYRSIKLALDACTFLAVPEGEARTMIRKMAAPRAGPHAATSRRSSTTNSRRRGNFDWQ
ncbi:MAG: hypothetical protein ABUS57_06420 [Pseudomonadota bacterium]